MRYTKSGKWVADEDYIEEEDFIVPDPESYPGYGWGYHGPWDDEYWDEVGGRPDER